MRDIQSCEQIVRKKTKGTLLLGKIALISLYSVFAAIGFIISVYAKSIAAPLIILTVAFDAILIFFTWKYTCVEYEYSVLGGEFYLARIYGKASRKELYECSLSRATVIAPYNERHGDKAAKASPAKVYYAASEKHSENSWFIIFEDENSKSYAVLFEPEDRMLVTLRHYAPRAMAPEGFAVKLPKEDTDNA